ncbi:hypothetical protein G6F56_001913 [Rhizopus delemar]|nr:hypothetical protein G6F56_001913 [Rhizopus delemar]
MFNVIKTRETSGMLNTRASLTPIQGPLYQISIRSQKLLVEYLTEFSSLIIKERGKTNDTNEYPLSLSDIDLLEIIYHILSNMDEKSQMLASIHTDFWKILVNSFFEKSSNNIYHTLFYRIFILLVSSYDEMTIAIIINESCLIQRLVDEYQNKAKKTDTRGYSLLILNHLRLMSDAQQSNTVTEIIANHTCYQSFLPTLRNDTLTQFQRIYSWELDGPRPPAHFGPSPPIQATHFSPYVGTMPLITNINNADYDGIDLGSEFAHSLGFNGTVGREEGFETPSEYLSRRNSDLSISSSQSSGSGPPVDMLFESLTPEEVTVPSKKKKKKKTKRYKW